MAHRAFTVSTKRTGRVRRVRVVVYDTRAEMHTAARRYRFSSDGFINALALTQPRSLFSFAADGSEVAYPGAGVVRLVRGQMWADVVSHEMVHMALAIYREDSGRASLRNMKNEETLCHIVSDLVKSANRQFWKAGIYE